jgi:hypothetical protein
MLRKVLLWIFGIAVLVYVGACVTLFVEQRSLIYYPQPNRDHAGITAMSLETPAGTMVVLTRTGPGNQAVLYFGGNGEDVSRDMPDLAQAFPAGSLYLLNYPGYGASAGHPSEQSITDAALALFDRVHADHSKVVVIGRSLGTGVAVHVAALRPVARLVLITPYDSLADPAAADYPLFPVRLLLRDTYASYKYAPLVTAPTLILAAGDDHVIPRASTERLRTRFKPGVATYVVIPDVGHGSISDSPDYYRLLAQP